MEKLFKHNRNLRSEKLSHHKAHFQFSYGSYLQVEYWPYLPRKNNNNTCQTYDKKHKTRVLTKYKKKLGREIVANLITNSPFR